MSHAFTPCLLPVGSSQKLALLVVTCSPATNLALILLDLALFVLVELLHLFAFLLEHLVELAHPSLLILLVSVDQKWTHDQLVEPLKVVTTGVLFPVLFLVLLISWDEIVVAFLSWYWSSAIIKSRSLMC